MICNKCGTQINEGVKFCPNCGQDLSAQAIYQQNTYNPAYQQNNYNQSYNNDLPVSSTPLS